jgi:hypothetical protein
MLLTPNLMLVNQLIEERQAEARRYARQRQLLNTGAIRSPKRRLSWVLPWPLRRQPTTSNSPPNLAAV